MGREKAMYKLIYIKSRTPRVEVSFVQWQSHPDGPEVQVLEDSRRIAKRVPATVETRELKTMELRAFQTFQSTAVMMVERVRGETSSEKYGRSQSSLKEVNWGAMFQPIPLSNPRARGHHSSR